MLTTGRNAVPGDPDITQASSNVEYDNVASLIDIVHFTNSYAPPEAPPISQRANFTGFIPHGSGPAPQRCGQVHHKIADAELETQRLCARKAVLQAELAEYWFELAKGVRQAAQLDRQRADTVSQIRARMARVRAIV